MSNLLLHHHLGMGDHIICNGLVRSLLDTNNFVYLLCKQSNLLRVSRMFEDERRIIPIPIPTEIDEHIFVKNYIKNVDIRYMRCGFSSWDINETFDVTFYRGAGIDYANRWNRFYFRRDKIAEKNAIEKMNPSGKKYIFVHDDPNRNMHISSPDSGYEIIRNDPSVNLFDMCSLLENAEEIHCMESSFKCLIEHLPLVTCPLYLYSGIRNDGHGRGVISGSRKTWIEKVRTQ